MVMRKRLRRVVYLFLSMMMIAFALRFDLVETVWQKSNREIARKQKFYTESISNEEFERFMLLYPEFKELGLSDDIIVSYHLDKPSKLIDWKTKIWFVYHKWDADRFFYVQQRLVSILHSIKVKNNASAMIEYLKNRKDEAAQNMINFQKQRLNADDFAATEMDMVRAKEDLLKKMFD